MKALTVRQPYANQIACGIKQYEYRTWTTKYRGRLLIVSALSQAEYGAQGPYGVAICEVDLVGIEYDSHFGVYAWHLDNPKPVANVPIRGKQRLFEV